MTAQIIEDDVAPATTTEAVEVKDNLDDLAVTDAAPAPSAATTTEAIPDKYAGKSIAEVIAMHQNAEQAIGRQSSEVGQLRSIVDDFIKTQSQSSKQEEQQDEEAPDFLDDPNLAVNKAIENHPLVKAASETVATTRKERALSKLKESHPDMTDLLGNPDFINWVGASKLRVKNFREANETSDVDSMSEIFTDFKATKAATKATVTATTKATSAAAKRDTTGVVTGAVDNTGAKIYRRIDIMKLMQSDPDRYEAMQPEILRAYAEKRVR